MIYEILYRHDVRDKAKDWLHKKEVEN